MIDSIEKLIDKYDDKRLEEPDYYFQWEEIIEDLKALLKLYQAQSGIKKVYERFKHLDVILSDIVSLNEDNDPIHATCYELWKAIKNETML